MLFRNVAPILAVVVFFFASPSAKAQVPGSDTAVLTAMLLQAVKDSAELTSLVTTAQRSLESAQATLAIARATTDAVGSVAAIIRDPSSLVDDVYAGFRQTFPEIEGLTKEAVGLYEDLRNPRTFTGEYDPYAMQKLIRAMRAGGDSLYHTMIAIDSAAYNLTDENLMTAEERAQLREGVAGFRSLLTLSPQGLTPQQAAVMSAEADVLQLQAQTAAAESLDQLSQMAKAKYLSAKEAGAAAAGRVVTASEELQFLIPSDELNPFGDDSWDARDFIPEPLEAELR